MTESGRTRYSNLPEADAHIQEHTTSAPEISYDEPKYKQQRPEQKPSMLKRILTWRKYLILVLTPILLLPIPIAITGTVSGLSLEKGIVTFQH